MTTDTWLRIGAVSIPLVGALTIWRWGTKFPGALRRVVVLLFGATALCALTLFWLNRYYACILSFGEQNCIVDAMATLSLFVLSILRAGSCLVLHGENLTREAVPLLLLTAAWAGMGLIQNLFLILVFLNLFFFAVDRRLKSKGLTWRFLTLRDDYQDDVRS
jgi:hypothetical protein